MTDLVLLKLFGRKPTYRLLSDEEALRLMARRGRKGLDSQIVGISEQI